MCGDQNSQMMLLSFSRVWCCLIGFCSFVSILVAKEMEDSIAVHGSALSEEESSVIKAKHGLSSINNNIRCILKQIEQQYKEMETAKQQGLADDLGMDNLCKLQKQLNEEKENWKQAFKAQESLCMGSDGDIGVCLVPAGATSVTGLLAEFGDPDKPFVLPKAYADMDLVIPRQTMLAPALTPNVLNQVLASLGLAVRDTGDVHVVYKLGKDDDVPNQFVIARTFDELVSLPESSQVVWLCHTNLASTEVIEEVCKNLYGDKVVVVLAGRYLVLSGFKSDLLAIRQIIQELDSGEKDVKFKVFPLKGLDILNAQRLVSIICPQIQVVNTPLKLGVSEKISGKAFVLALDSAPKSLFMIGNESALDRVENILQEAELAIGTEHSNKVVYVYRCRDKSKLTIIYNSVNTLLNQKRAGAVFNSVVSGASDTSDGSVIDTPGGGWTTISSLVCDSKLAGSQIVMFIDQTALPSVKELLSKIDCNEPTIELNIICVDRRGDEIIDSNNTYNGTLSPGTLGALQKSSTSVMEKIFSGSLNTMMESLSGGLKGLIGLICSTTATFNFGAWDLGQGMATTVSTKYSNEDGGEFNSIYKSVSLHKSVNIYSKVFLQLMNNVPAEFSAHEEGDFYKVQDVVGVEDNTIKEAPKGGYKPDDEYEKSDKKKKKKLKKDESKNETTLVRAKNSGLCVKVNPHVVIAEGQPPRVVLDLDVSFDVHDSDTGNSRSVQRRRVQSVIQACSGEIVVLSEWKTDKTNELSQGRKGKGILGRILGGILGKKERSEHKGTMSILVQPVLKNLDMATINMDLASWRPGDEIL